MSNNASFVSKEKQSGFNGIDFRLTWITMTSLLIFVFGMIVNVTTVYIYTRSKKLRQNKIFELILAAFDIYALLVLLPIFTFDLYANEGLSVYFSLAISAVIISYYVTILCSTICRYVAVYHPFSFKAFFKKWRMRFVVIIYVTAALFFIRNLVLRAILKVAVSPVYFIDIILLSSVCFISIAVLFIFIIAKLMKQNTVGAQGAVQDGETPYFKVMHRKHLVAVKTFGAVSLCFLASYVTSFSVGTGLIPVAALYMYFLNHVCNPVIYFLINRDFREKIRGLVTFLSPVSGDEL